MLSYYVRFETTYWNSLKDIWTVPWLEDQNKLPNLIANNKKKKKNTDDNHCVIYGWSIYGCS